jgi:hypothetical protein
MAAVVPHERVASDFCAALPRALALLVFARLPVHVRARCALVCRAWRDAVAERSLWTRLDLSYTSSMPRARMTPEFLHGAAARAGGALQALVLPVILGDAYGPDINDQALLAVLAANAELRELTHPNSLSCAQIEAVLRAAPQLRVFNTRPSCSAPDAAHILGNEPPFGVLRATHVSVKMRGDDGGNNATVNGEAAVIAVAARAAAHEWVEHASFSNAPLHTSAALDAVVDAALAGRFTSLTFFQCSLVPAAAPALARLLGSRSLTHLGVYGIGEPLLDGPGAALLCSALQNNSTLKCFTLSECRLFDDVAIAVLLLRTVTQQHVLSSLHICDNPVGAADQALVGRLLGELVASATALRCLEVSWCGLSDDGLGPLMDALPQNTQLEELRCYSEDLLSEAFVNTRLAPAVRANTSLRELFLTTPSDEGVPGYAVMLELQQLVEARNDYGEEDD